MRGSIAPAEQHVKSIAAIPSNETYLMMDTYAGANIPPRGFDQSATDDSTVAPVQLSTATDDPMHGKCGKEIRFWFERWPQESGPIQCGRCQLSRRERW